MNLTQFRNKDLDDIRVALFDVYGTLLLSSPRPDAEKAFSSWWIQWIHTPMPNYLEFKKKLRDKISISHNESQLAGVDFPEVQWLSIVQSALEDHGWKNSESAADLEAIATSLVEVGHTFSIMPGAVELIRSFQSAGLPLGIVSNAQPYTPIHLKEALASGGIHEWPFDEAWSFWSWKFGFSKPCPAVFQIFSARAEAVGWKRSQILYFGDRPDNDIKPAQRAGWRTVQVTD